MKKKKNYLKINKISDYEKSAFWNMEYDKEGFSIPLNSMNTYGYFLSRLFDSREEDLEWHRLVLKLSDETIRTYQVTIYATNQEQIMVGGTHVLLKDYIKDDSISIEEKKEVLKSFAQKTVIGERDILLHEIFGRFLFLGITVYRESENALVFEEITAYFPKQSFLSYLPEVYEASDTEHFLDHFLSVFQSMFEDQNDEIARIPERLNIHTAKEEELTFICNWIGITKSQMWSKEKKVKLLSKVGELYPIRGTRKALETLLFLYLGAPVFLIENHQWQGIEKDQKRRKLYRTLYGDKSDGITILCREENVRDKREHQTLIQVIKSMVPAQIEVHLIVLKPYIFLEQHSYLGVNSVLGTFRGVVLDGKSVLSLTKIEKPE